MDSKARQKFRDEMVAKAVDEFPDNVTIGLADSIIDLFVIIENLRKERSYWIRRTLRAEKHQSAGYMRRKGHPSCSIDSKPYEPCETDDWIKTGRE